MPKYKTRKAVAKRFKVTKKGEVRRNCSKKRHLLTNKPRSKKRALRRGALVSDAERKRVKLMMPYG